MSKIFKNSSDKSYMNGDHKKYLSRITKTLYYGKLPKTDCLSLPVTELAAEIFSEAKKGKSLERLHCYKAADISRKACVAPCSLVLAILYLEKLKTSNSQYLEKVNPSDLFLVSLMVSCKFLFDDGEGDDVFLDEWAASGSVSIKELVCLEKDFLNAMNWEIFVSDSKFQSKLREIESILALKQGTSRGYFTYTELDTLSIGIEIQSIIHCVAAITAILALTYVAGLMTIVGSVFLTSQIPGTSLYVKKIEKAEWEPDFVPNTDIRVVEMLQTSIILASIQSNTTTYQENAENVTWDYWNNPVMEWLAESSRIVTDAADLRFDYSPFHLESGVMKGSRLELEDLVHRADKTRIQDQMESNWHTEWMESLKLGVYTESVTF